MAEDDPNFQWSDEEDAARPPVAPDTTAAPGLTSLPEIQNLTLPDAIAQQQPQQEHDQQVEAAKHYEQEHANDVNHHGNWNEVYTDDGYLPNF
jgi:hypothetical protein